MTWLKHIVLTLAAAVMTVGPALSCCAPSHAELSTIPDASHDAGAVRHHMDGAGAAGHPCDESARAPHGDHSTGVEDGLCDGCADCSILTTQTAAHLSIAQSKIDYDVELIRQAPSQAMTVRPYALIKNIKPPATAPPRLLSPVQQKQILIV